MGRPIGTGVTSGKLSEVYPDQNKGEFSVWERCGSAPVAGKSYG